MKYEEDLDELEVKIICDKPEQFLWVHDIVEGFIRLANQDVIITDDDIDPKFREAFGKYLKKLS